MKNRFLVTVAAACATLSLGANARDVGWEFGGELIYQNSLDVDFEGGSSASLDSDLGIAVTFGYRFSDRLELTMGLDWNTVDYSAVIQSATFPNVTANVDGDMETFTPRVGLNFNFMEGPITPFVTAMIGYAFIDTNIPDGPPETGCWWDPWYGQICTTWQSTRSVDEFTYAAGLGVRWDFSDSLSMKFAYEKHWIDVSSATGTPDPDQFKLGISVMY